MPHQPGEDDKAIRASLGALEAAIAERVRTEQRRCPLTALSNLVALEADLGERVKSAKFWAAFVEIDKFKSVNDRFGHTNADAILQAIAELMRAARMFFPATAVPYRAHGDEFYFVGDAEDVGDDQIGDGLEALRHGVAQIKISAGTEGVMDCKVSVGWLTRVDLGDTGDGSVLTARGVMDALEVAMQAAKVPGNRVVRYTADLRTDPWISLRATCSSCACRFTFDLRASDNIPSKSIACPHCFKRAKRPPAPVPKATKPPVRL